MHFLPYLHINDNFGLIEALAAMIYFVAGGTLAASGPVLEKLAAKITPFLIGPLLAALALGLSIAPERALGLPAKLSAVGLIALAAYNPVAQRWLGNRLFGYLGDISYPLYLVHFPVILAVYGIASDYLGLPYMVALITIITFVLSHVLHKYIEDPAILFGKTLIISKVRLPN